MTGAGMWTGMTLRGFLALCRCSLRLAAAWIRRDPAAAWQVLCDVEDIHRGLGRDASDYDRERIGYMRDGTPV